MCKTRFGNQGVILDFFKCLKKTLMTLVTPPSPIMATVMKNNHFFQPFPLTIWRYGAFEQKVGLDGGLDGWMGTPKTTRARAVLKLNR